MGTNKVTRAERRAALRQQLKNQSAVDRVSPELMQLLTKSTQQLSAAQKAATEAQGTINSVSAQIRETHKMKAGDSVDMGTGFITRGRSRRKL